jgi:mono/diheme cytochrome c family protein
MVLRYSLIGLVVLQSCSSHDSSEKTEIIDSDRLYNIHCASCHKPDGTGGISGAKNLLTTNLSKDEIQNTITNGQGDMMPFKEILSENQIEVLSEFVVELRNKK